MNYGIKQRAPAVRCQEKPTGDKQVGFIGRRPAAAAEHEKATVKAARSLKS